MRKITLVSLKPLLMHLHQVAMGRYSVNIMDYLTPKKLNQLVGVYFSNELAKRMAWAEYEEGNLEGNISLVFSRAPWHKGDHALKEDITAHIYDPLFVSICRMMDDHGIEENTADIWHAETRSSSETSSVNEFEYLLICEGDYRIHVWNKLKENYRRKGGIQWGFDQGLYGFGITEAWSLPGVGGAMGLDHPGDN